jgi:ATP synthase protein I
MSYASTLLWKSISRLLLGQFIVVLSLGCCLWLAYGRHHAFSVFYGGFVAVLGALLLGWHLQKIARSIPNRLNPGTLYFSSGALWRFLTATFVLWIGIKWLHLLPFPLVIGFGIAQAAYFFGWNYRSMP